MPVPICSRKPLSFALATRIAVLASLTFAAGAARAIDGDALLETLVRKGVLTPKEAANIQDEDAKKQADIGLNKIKLSNSVSELRIYGDLRARYQYSNSQSQEFVPQYRFVRDPDYFYSGHSVDKPRTSIPHGDQQSTWLYRLRLGADIKLGEHWFGGLELSTNPSSDNSDAVAGNDFGKFGIYISKAYIGYSPADWLTLTIGKTANPFYTTDLVWDPDINPTGLYERFSFHDLWGAHSAAPADGKSSPAVRPWTLDLVAGQLIYKNHNEGYYLGDYGYDSGNIVNDYHATPHDETTDAYVFETQLIGSLQVGKVAFTFAPAWLVENASLTEDASNTVSFGSNRNLSLILAPGDISFHLGGLKTKILWDFAYNTQGAGRYNDVYGLGYEVDAKGRKINTHSAQDDIAWLAGIQFGENKKRGDLSLAVNYRQTGISSVDPNLNDSDFALGYLNMQGYKISVAYNLTDFAMFQVSWFDAWNFRKNLLGGAATSFSIYGGVANANQVQVLQVDLNLSF